MSWRLAATKHIINDKKIGHYMEILKNLVDVVEQVLAADHEVTEMQRKNKLPIDTSDFDKANLTIAQVLVPPEEEPRQSPGFSFGRTTVPWWKRDFPTFPTSRFPSWSTTVADFFTNAMFVDATLTQQKWMTAYQKLFISTFIRFYFKSGDALYPVHQNMHNATSIRKSIQDNLKAYIASAGPFMIKILQQVGNDRSLNARVKEITQSVFTSISPLPIDEFEFLTSKLDLHDKYKHLDSKAIGAASIGETHICRDPRTGKPTGVVKFIKPLSVWMFLCEVDFLLTVLWPQFQPGPNPSTQERLDAKKCRLLLLFLIREFAKEFNVEREATGTEDAREIYHRPKLGIFTPALLQRSTAPVPALVLSYIKGQSLEDFISGLTKIPESEWHALIVPIQRRITVLVGLWLKELFWGSGRFDADPHVGNFIVPTFEYMKLNGAKPWIALIDFGSHGKLDPYGQCVVFNSLVTGGRIVQFSDCVPNPPTQGEPVSDAEFEVILEKEPLVQYFPNFRTMSRVDQLKLVSNIQQRTTRLPGVHERNVKYIHRIITDMWKTCGVWDNPEETKELVNKCLNYEKKIDFLFISLTVAQYGETIGVCSWNSVLMYGRGLAYLEGLWSATSSLCVWSEKLASVNKSDLWKFLMGGVPKCDQRSLFRVVWPFFFTNPGLGYRMARGYPRPAAEGQNKK